MTYKETVNFLEKSFPAYHLLGPAAYKADLSNTEQLMEHLGHPEKRFRAIHVAGTNGKGSVAHSLASILQFSGLKVGLYTSPHLVDLRERVRINGEMISTEEVVEFVETNKHYFKERSLSFFEMMTGLAFHMFAVHQVDVAVVEVGMGGRLDSTNVVHPDLSIITNIGLDHTQFLGTTHKAIAGEKAGIIKEGVPVVIGETLASTQPVFIAKAEAMHSPITFADQRYHVRVDSPMTDERMMDLEIKQGRSTTYSHLLYGLTGSYQRKNVVTTLCAVDVLRTVGYEITEQQVREGMKHVVSATGLHGRWEYYGSQPDIICETAHNADGIKSMLDKLRTLHYERLHLVYGCVNDKDYPRILHLLPPDAVYYFTQPSTPRALDVNILSKAAESTGRCGLVYPHCKQAIESARLHAGPKDVILITGSIFLVADAIPVLTAKEEEK
ncbi:MAG: folylpolyglutamate synthase/dihydrofolate synthase family protein [Bacteroidales bacterium]|nr:folylpolyglutamate synthase/dihydrofolate synthase family protein [Bacteroidales bacterium]